MPDDNKLENYKKNVIKIIDIWADEVEKVSKELTPLEAELKNLDEKDPGNKQRIDELKKKCAELHKRLENANASLRFNFIAIDIPPKADEKELIKIPPWAKDIIKRKGLPLGKDVSIAPTIDFDFKAKKLKSFGLKITW